MKFFQSMSFSIKSLHKKNKTIKNYASSNLKKLKGKITKTKIFSALGVKSVLFKPLFWLVAFETIIMSESNHRKLEEVIADCNNIMLCFTDIFLLLGKPRVFRNRNASRRRLILSYLISLLYLYIAIDRIVYLATVLFRLL